jgi:hypothetical protein
MYEVTHPLEVSGIVLPLLLISLSIIERSTSEVRAREEFGRNISALHEYSILEVV